MPDEVLQGVVSAVEGHYVPVYRKASHPEMGVTPPPYWTIATVPDGRWAARVMCWFGHWIDLSRHTVTRTGFLEPDEVACTSPGCRFKARLRLMGWPPPEAK